MSISPLLAKDASKIMSRLNLNLNALQEISKEKACRICFGGEEEIKILQNQNNSKKIEKLKNPLVSPCLCTGSSRYIHLECLQQWLKRSKTDYPYQECTTTIYKVSSCELCMARYPDQVNIRGHKYEIF